MEFSLKNFEIICRTVPCHKVSTSVYLIFDNIVLEKWIRKFSPAYSWVTSRDRINLSGFWCAEVIKCWNGTVGISQLVILSHKTRLRGQSLVTFPMSLFILTVFNRGQTWLRISHVLFQHVLHHQVVTLKTKNDSPDDSSAHHIRNSFQNNQ